MKDIEISEMKLEDIEKEFVFFINSKKIPQIIILNKIDLENISQEHSRNFNIPVNDRTRLIVKYRGMKVITSTEVKVGKILIY